MRTKNKAIQIIFFLAIITSIVFSQQEHKIIKYDENERVAKIDVGDSSIAVITYHKKYGNTVYVYDYDGNELLKIYDRTQFYVHRAFVSNDNQLILFYLKEEGKKDILKSINIYTQKENWRTRFNAGDLSISEDRTKVLTKEQPVFKHAIFEVINLADGFKQNLNYKENFISAEWIDNDRVIVGTQTRVIRTQNPNYTPSTFDRMSIISKELADLRDSVKSGKIDYSTYKKTVDSLLVEKRGVFGEKNNMDVVVKSKGSRAAFYRKGTGSSQPRFIEKRVYSAIVFNINSNSIEIQKELKRNDDYLKFANVGGSLSQIYVNGNKGIYFSGYLNKEKVFLKYSSDLKLMDAFILGEGEFRQYSKLGRCFFTRSNRDEELKILDEEQGLFRNLNSSDEIFTTVKSFNYRIMDYKIFEIYQVKENGSVIEFSGIKN